MLQSPIAPSQIILNNKKKKRPPKSKITQNSNIFDSQTLLYHTHKHVCKCLDNTMRRIISDYTEPDVNEILSYFDDFINTSEYDDEFMADVGDTKIPLALVQLPSYSILDREIIAQSILHHISQKQPKKALSVVK